MVRYRAAATSHDVEESTLSPFPKVGRHRLGGQIVAAELVREARVRVRADVELGDPGKLLDVGPELVWTESAVQTDADRVCVAYGVVERLDRLAREGAAARISHGSGDDQRKVASTLLEHLLHREDCGLSVQRVEDRLN